MSLPSSLGALGERRFRLLFGARTVSALGGTMGELALAFAVLDLGRPRDLGFVILAREIPTVVLLLLGGVWGDRVRRDLVLIGSDLARGGAQAVIATLLLTGTASVVSVALVQIVYGGASAFGRPAFQGLVPQTVPAERLQEANALLGLSTSVVGIAGPALGAAIVVAADPGWAIAADSVTFFVSALMLLRIRLPRTLRMHGASVLADFREGWQEFVSRPWVVAMVVSFGIFQLSYFPAFFVLGPYVAKSELGGAGAWGAILAAGAAGALVGGVVALRVRFSRPLVATLLLVLPPAVHVITLGAGASVWVLAGLGFVSGVGFAIGGAVWFSTLQEKIPEHAISRISSFDWFGSVALNPIGYAAIGPLSELVGVGPALIGSGVVNVGSSLAMLAVPSVRELRGGPEPEPAPVTT